MLETKYPPIPENASANEPQATWLLFLQILPLTATGAYQQDIRGIGKSINVDVIYLDFAKEFDKVNHGILLNKLKKIGIDGKTHVWIHNFLLNRQQCVVNNRTSREAQVRSGVPQGSVLRPLLFVIHISVLNYKILDSTVSCFADDN